MSKVLLNPCQLSSRVLASVLFLMGLTVVGCAAEPEPSGDYIRDLQNRAVFSGTAEFGHWGVDPKNYTNWGSHSNRLIPVYTFGTKGAGAGIDLDSYTGANSPYRSEDALKRIYGRLPTYTLNPQAEYCDQTNVYDIQAAALKAGKKHIFLVIFDGMDWQTTQAAAIIRHKQINYTEGRGTGFHFQDYTANGTSQFGFMCTSPHNAGTEVDVDAQTVKNPGGTMFGGYDPASAGDKPWSVATDIGYPISKPTNEGRMHAYTDSSSSASSMTAGLKTYNNTVNTDFTGNLVPTVAHNAQDAGYAVGVVTSVPIPHATPAAAYAHNVDRDDYQDLTRDLIGRKSISHPEQPLPGMDIVIGAGFGETRDKDNGGGKNFVPGNPYLTADDLRAVDIAHGGKYVVAQRTAGVKGAVGLQKAAEEAAEKGARLLGFYGVAGGHLPFQTADGDYLPAAGRKLKAETYKPAELEENPTLAEMTTAALTALKNRDTFWLMVEAGDVDWANHDNNIDNSAGAVASGDAAIQVITDWVEKHSNWEESVLIVTADHGHYLNVLKPELLTGPAPTK